MPSLNQPDAGKRDMQLISAALIITYGDISGKACNDEEWCLGPYKSGLNKNQAAFRGKNSWIVKYIFEKIAPAPQVFFRKHRQGIIQRSLPAASVAVI